MKTSSTKKRYMWFPNRYFIRMKKETEKIHVDITRIPPNYPTAKHASHSFSHRASFPQVIAYLVIAGGIAIYFVCLRQLYQNWVLMGLYLGSGLLMVLTAVVASCSNPTDPTVYHYKWSKITNNIVFETDFSKSFYC